MPLIQPPLMVTGGTHPARALRMMIRDLSRGSQGVTEGGDLKVRSTTPGAAVRVGPGSAVVAGAAWGQGSYTQANAGDTVVPIAPTGAQPRTDLLVLRVEDPEFEGTRDPAKDDVGYFHVLTDQSATVAAPPPGMTAIPLARISLPANCATVTDAVITDLRRLTNPRRSRVVQMINGFPYSEFPQQAGVWQDNWPPGGVVSLDVPKWAVRGNIITTVAGLRVWGETLIGFRNKLGGIIGGEFQVDTDTITVYSKINVVCADTPWFSVEMRGTSVPLRLQGGRYNQAKGGCDVSQSTALIFDVEYVEETY
ncbi:hypothetical protein ACIGXM_35910 [Kitasatospora sp. NPDC052896]|uniref:hypothetical protein n=1 Tax=Kitasatospora sp. NPDC052896 TaxID=3364061 RepID=UPI0037C5BC87